MRLMEGGKSLSQNPINTSRSVTVVNGLENQNQDFAVFQNAPRLTLEVPMLIEQIGDDIDGENQGDNDGYKVSVSDDGKTAIIGSWGSAEPGHARVFRYDAANDRWIQKGQTLVGTMAWDLFGSDVAINSDGSTVAVGA